MVLRFVTCIGSLRIAIGYKALNMAKVIYHKDVCALYWEQWPQGYESRFLQLTLCVKV